MTGHGVYTYHPDGGGILSNIIDRKEGNYFVGRTEMDSPDVDNEVLVKAQDTYVRIGDFSQVRVVSADHYDLFGEIVTID